MKILWILLVLNVLGISLATFGHIPFYGGGLHGEVYMARHMVIWEPKVYCYDYAGRPACYGEVYWLDGCSMCTCGQYGEPRYCSNVACPHEKPITPPTPVWPVPPMPRQNLQPLPQQPLHPKQPEQPRQRIWF